MENQHTNHSMTTITPQQFKEKFQQVVSNAHADLIERWERPRDYTSFMRDKILREIAPLLSVQVYSADYYTLDCIYFIEQDAKHFPNNTYATNIAIALEHENDIKGTATEMNKLQLFNAPLKVLITYCLLATERDDYLQRYNKILRDGDIFGDFATLRRHLVIFGSLQGRAATAVNWHFCVYESSGFQELSAA
jgi:hypothetical protein